MLYNINLNRCLPLLFGVPGVKASNWAIIISLMTIACSVIAYALADLVVNFPFFHFICTLLAIHFATALITSGGNALYFFRYFLTWILIFITGLVFSIYRGDVLVSWFGANYQTLENTRILVLAGVFSLTGSLIGWHSSIKRFRSRICMHLTLAPNRNSRLRQVGYLMAFGFAALYVWKSGGIVGRVTAYGDREEGFELTFGVFNIFHFMGIALMLLSSIEKTEINKNIILLAALSLIPGVMAGSRADFLPQIFLLLMLVYNRNIANIINNKEYLKLIIYTFIGIFLLVAGYFAATFVAVYRAGGVDVLEVLNLMLKSDEISLIREIDGNKIIFLETGNMILGGLYSAIVQVQHNYTGLLFGESYLNYFLIAPPAFLGLPRPLGLEWFTEINGQTMSQGGIFEVAEAYWNFGLIGCFVISFSLSYFFGWLLRRGMGKTNYFYLVWYFIFGFHGFRSIWYQNFSYFRLMTVMLIVYAASLFFAKWFVVDRKNA